MLGIEILAQNSKNFMSKPSHVLLILKVLSVTLIINKLSTLPKNYKFFKRDYSKLDSEALISEVRNVNWSEVLGSETGTTDVNTVFHNFYDRIAEIINKYAPIRKLSRKEIKSLSKPWVRTSFISDLLRRRIHIFLTN